MTLMQLRGNFTTSNLIIYCRRTIVLVTSQTNDKDCLVVVVGLRINSLTKELIMFK